MKQNLHLHTTFCDGKDTPEEMIEEAIARGFQSLGFSMHSYLTCSASRVTPEEIARYRQEITRLKEQYAGKLEIYLGIEYDIYSDCAWQDYDYTIASVHYLHTKEGRQTFDYGEDVTLRYIKDYFDGDNMKFAKAYYETLATAPRYGNFDIIGHFDLITKHNETLHLFDTDSKTYRGYVTQAIDALQGKIPLFEVNTGAVARGYRTTPYPETWILKILLEKGFGAVITSDCHDKRFLDCHYEESVALLREAGFKSQFYLTPRGFEEVAL